MVVCFKFLSGQCNDNTLVLQDVDKIMALPTDLTDYQI